MVERIRILLETRQLTPTQFADAIGIARPIVSHILSGRNKPSLEVVQRILTAMPDLSMAWLLNGSGPMLALAVPQPTPVAASPEVAPAPQTVAPPKERVAPAASTRTGVQASVANAAKRFENNSLPAEPRRPATGAVAQAIKRFTPKNPDSASALLGQNEKGPTPPLPTPEPVATSAPSALAEEAQQEPSIATQLITKAEKPIRRIVIFYQDGSFADYQPE
jgi:transcriptional regulator with XRE-family HTH domain